MRETTLKMKEAMLSVCLTFEECGCCGGLHSRMYAGECRDNDQRFTCDQLDDLYGEGGWELVALEDQYYD